MAVSHGNAVLAIWCTLRRHDWIAMPDFMVPSDLRPTIPLVEYCMRCGEHRAHVRESSAYR